MTATQPVHSTSRKQKLIEGLQRLIAAKLDLPLVPIANNKQPIGDRWQQRPFTAAQLIKAIANGGVEVPIQNQTQKIQPLGFGLITGRSLVVSGFTHYLMALDLDGASTCRRIDLLSGGQPLPKTVAFTSGRPGRCQYLFLIPEQYKDAVKTKKIKTGVIGDDGKAEQIEFRWQNLQSVLPPSVHPTTGEYHWVEGCAIDQTPIAIAPDWMIEQMLVKPAAEGQRGRGAEGQGRIYIQENLSSAPPLLRSSAQKTHRRTAAPGFSKWTEVDFALSYLDALAHSRADDYDYWLAVGMALHSVDDSLLGEWEQWSRLSPKYQPGVCEQKWRSFSTAGGVTLGTLAHMAKQDGWQSPFAKKNKRKSSTAGIGFGSSNTRVSTKTSSVTDDTDRTSDSSKPELLNIQATVTTVTNLLKQGLLDYQEHAELDAIQVRSTISKAAFWKLVASVRTSLDEVQPDDTSQFQRLIDWQNTNLNFKQILPPQLASAFERDAEILNIDPVSLWQYFLPTVLSLAGKRVNLDLESHTIPAIAWTCIVGESGTGKSRAESVILGEIKHRQYREKQRWLQQLQEYKQTIQKSKDDNSEVEPPSPERKYLFEVATIQAVMRRLSEQRENGSIWARDEIAGLFKSLGQFQARKGENEGLECLLKMWDGSGSFVDRVSAESDSYAVFETRLSIAGGIQPGAFRAAFKDPDDPQGVQARFLYAIPKVFPARRIRGRCQLNDLLPPLYNWLEQLPSAKISLSADADARYSDLVAQIGQEAEGSATPAERAWLRKLPTQLLRIALALHLLECYYNRDGNLAQLQRDTLERAVHICSYYRSAFAVVREKTVDSDKISSVLLKIWDMATINPDGVTPRDVYRAIKSIGRRAKEIGRGVGAYTVELFSQLVQMGKGKLEKSGRSYRFLATVDCSTRSVDSVQNYDSTSIVLDKLNSVKPENIQDKNADLNTPVPEVTNFQTLTQSDTNPSSSTNSSPVTPNSDASNNTLMVDKKESYANEKNLNNCQFQQSKFEDLNWLLQFLADLESAPQPIERFSSMAQLVTLFNEAEQRAESCYQELCSICSNYFERISQELVRISKQFSDSEFSC